MTGCVCLCLLLLASWIDSLLASPPFLLSSSCLIQSQFSWNQKETGFICAVFLFNHPPPHFSFQLDNRKSGKRKGRGYSMETDRGGARSGTMELYITLFQIVAALSWIQVGPLECLYTKSGWKWSYHAQSVSEVIYIGYRPRCLWSPGCVDECVCVCALVSGDCPAVPLTTIEIPLLNTHVRAHTPII